jgi:hypothetical protein
MKPDESFWRRLAAYLRFERRRASVTPLLIILGGIAVFALLAARSALWGRRGAVPAPWPYWLIAAVCVGPMVVICADRGAARVGP